MDQWWLNDDPFSPDQDADEVFRTLMQGNPSDAQVGLRVDDYAELDKLLSWPGPTYETEEENVNSPTFSTNSESSVESPTMPSEDLGLQDLLIQAPGDISVLSVKADYKNQHKDDLGDCVAELPLRHNVLFQSEYRQPMSNHPQINQQTESPADDDILNFFLGKCSDDNSLYDEFSTLINSCNTLSSPTPPGGFETPPCSPDLEKPESQLPAVDDVVDMIASAGDTTNESTEPTESSNTPVFSCQFCGRDFKHKIGLKNHERSHMRGETHVCGYCGKTFRYKNKLRRHVNIHARQMRICRYCGTVQANDYELVQHEKRHKLEDKKSVSDCLDVFQPIVSLNELYNEGLDCSTGSVMPVHYQHQPWSPGSPMAIVRTRPYNKPIRYNSV